MGDADDESGSEGRSKPVLGDHERRGKRFIPPFLHHLGGMTDVRWIDRQAPEVAWISLLLDRHGLGVGADAALAAAQSLRKVRPSARGIRASDYAGLEPEEYRRVREELGAAKHGHRIAPSLRPMAALYPTFPMRELLGQCKGEQPDDRATLRRVLTTLTDRWTREATLVQGTVVYIAVVCGFLKPMAIPGGGLREIEHFPRTEESKLAAGVVRASTSFLLGSGEASSAGGWPTEFWHRGLDLDPCFFGERG